MTKKRMHIWVSGKVQGVFFRAHTLDLAKSLGLTGWVRNLPDGRVEIVAEGDDASLQQLLSWCHEGPPAARVSRVEWREEPASGELDSFVMKY